MADGDAGRFPAQQLWVRNTGHRVWGGGHRVWGGPGEAQGRAGVGGPRVGLGAMAFEHGVRAPMASCTRDRVRLTRPYGVLISAWRRAEPGTVAIQPQRGL
jgi:hypothetical protein